MLQTQNVNLYSYNDMYFAPWISMLDSHANGNTVCYHCQYYQHRHNYRPPSEKFVDNLKSFKLLLGLYFYLYAKIRTKFIGICKEPY
jgi:hypothetical protein